jgi:Cd(II)/Pb(II)-responsive transcriptional regulator
MKIGDLAKRTGCKVETVRYYESEGLLPEPARNEANYRLYGEPHVERLMFIRNCRALDMTLGEIRALLGFKDDGGQDCGNVDALLDQHIEQVAERITELQRLEAQLRALRQSCGERRSVEECGILQMLTSQ